MTASAVLPFPGPRREALDDPWRIQVVTIGPSRDPALIGYMTLRIADVFVLHHVRIVFAPNGEPDVSIPRRPVLVGDQAARSETGKRVTAHVLSFATYEMYRSFSAAAIAAARDVAPHLFVPAPAVKAGRPHPEVWSPS